MRMAAVKLMSIFFFHVFFFSVKFQTVQPQHGLTFEVPLHSDQSDSDDGSILCKQTHRSFVRQSGFCIYLILEFAHKHEPHLACLQPSLAQSDTGACFERCVDHLDRAKCLSVWLSSLVIEDHVDSDHFSSLQLKLRIAWLSNC